MVILNNHLSIWSLNKEILYSADDMNDIKESLHV